MANCRTKHRRRLALAPALLLTSLAALWAQTPATRHIPARDIPVPKNLSPELREMIAGPVSEEDKVEPKTLEAWRRLIAKRAARVEKILPKLRSSLNACSEPVVIAGVKAFEITPAKIAPENRNRLLMHIHGGAYVFYPGESGTPEAVLMAHYLGVRVISVDYRMAPDHPFPAGLEDTVAVWKELIRNCKPANMGIFGTSAGGGLTMSTVLRLKELNTPRPGAIAVGTPWCDITKTGDSWYTNGYVDHAVPYYEGVIAACARIYAGGRDMKSPLISPLYGDLSGFPPTILITGTRDVLLSDTVRAHRKLVNAGVTADLHVFEAHSHAQYIVGIADNQEAREVYGEMARFFRRHLGR